MRYHITLWDVDLVQITYTLCYQNEGISWSCALYAMSTLLLKLCGALLPSNSHPPKKIQIHLLLVCI